jgi:hypothetical protein
MRDGASADDLRRMLHLDGSAMIARFIGLLRLEPDVQHLVGWGRRDRLLSMSTAAEISKVPPDDQLILAQQALERGFSKDEVKQVVQLRQRSREPIERCIEKIVALRPQVEQRHAFIGAISDQALKKRLAAISQANRDSILRSAIETRLSGLSDFTARLGVGRFSVIGDARLAAEMKRLDPEFESAINEWLAQEIDHG